MEMIQSQKSKHDSKHDAKADRGASKKCAARNMNTYLCSDAKHNRRKTVNTMQVLQAWRALLAEQLGHTGQPRSTD